LIWNYNDDDISGPPANIDLALDGLPSELTRGTVEHFRIDSTHSNAFAAWKQMGSPQSLSAGQYEVLQKEGQLQLVTSPESVPIQKGSVHLSFTLPQQSMSLVRLAW
jgi:xylan 1,4-beta-xylosidase